MSKKLYWALLACMGIALSGCGESETPAAGQKNAVAAKKSSGNAETDWREKAQVYIELNNRIMPLISQKKRQDRSAQRAKNGEFQQIRTDSYMLDDVFVKRLQEAIALPGKLPAGVDAAGKNLLSVVDKFLPTWNQLQEYNKAKKYEDDKGEKGKQLLVAYHEGMQTLYAAVDEFDKQVDIVAKQASEKALAEYKKKGLLLEMHTSLAMAAAEKIIDTFDTAEDFKDQAKLDAANAQLAEMETNIEAMKVEHAKRKEKDAKADAKSKTLPRIDRYESIEENLIAFAGYYREARKNNPSRFNSAVEQYNRAVQERNRM
ncbi:MAG: YiiG family protein [Candidatus Accumulibacter sp.]|jgi:hypothetical protein|nr:YiiG family protein [Accumulibacter sp.]